MGFRDFMATFMQGDKRNASFDYNDTPENDKEMELVSWVANLFEQDRMDRQPWEAPWKKVFEFIMGQQWEDIPEWKADIVENYMFTTLVGMVALMTENRPRFEVFPEEPGVMDDYVDAMNKLMFNWWDELEMSRVNEEVTTNALMYSTGIYQNTWDGDLGRICSHAVDPQCIYLDKDARSVRTAQRLFHVSRMPYYDVLKYWPESKGKFAPGLSTVEEMDDHRKMPYSSGMWLPFASIEGPSGSQVPYVRSGLGDEGISEDGMVQILQLWIKDPSYKVVDLLDAAGKAFKHKNGERVRVRVPTYPGGRHIIRAGNRIIHDAPNPYWHGEFPYVDQKCYLVPNEYLGISAMQNLVSPQMQINKTQSFIIDMMNATAAPPWVVDSNCGVDPKAIDPNKPGQWIPKRPGSEVRREPAPTLPQYIDRLYQNERMAIDEISGLPESLFGQKAAGVQSGVAFQQLASTGLRKIGLPTRHMEDALARNGRQWIGLAQQYYDEARHILVTDPQTEQQQWVEITPEMVRKRWGVKTVPGSTLREDKAFLHQQAMELGSIGWIDAEAGLPYINFPGAKKVVERMRQKAEQDARVAAIMGSRQQGGQAAGGRQRTGTGG